MLSFTGSIKRDIRSAYAASSSLFELAVSPQSVFFICLHGGNSELGHCQSGNIEQNWRSREVKCSPHITHLPRGHGFASNGFRNAESNVGMWMDLL